MKRTRLENLPWLFTVVMVVVLLLHILNVVSDSVMSAMALLTLLSFQVADLFRLSREVKEGNQRAQVPDASPLFRPAARSGDARVSR